MAVRPVHFDRYDRWGKTLGRLTVLSATHEEALDSTDKLELRCTDDLVKGDRVVWADRQGTWHEHIVDQTDRLHDATGAPITTATCIGSVAELLDDYIVDRRPTGDVAHALDVVLSETRWSRGRCDLTTEASHTFYHESVREALSEIAETWGGEMVTSVDVGPTGVTGRSVAFVSRRGDQDGARRFTWTKDLLSVKRTVGADNPVTRVYGYGKGVETDAGGYGRRLQLNENLPGTPAYLEDAGATAVWGHPGPDGKTLPAVGRFVDEECEDVSQLHDETWAYLQQHKQPQVSYEADVVDLVAFGRDWEGVALGDAVDIVDRGFGDGGLRLRGRVSGLKRDLLDGDCTVTFGTLADALTDMWRGVVKQVSTLSGKSVSYDSAAGQSASWLERLQTSLARQFGSAGNYVVTTFEGGTTYSNVPLDATTGLPLDGSSGDMWALNLSGAGLRIAAGLTADGKWDWRTFGTGKGFSADAITAGTLSADRISGGTLDASLVTILNLMHVGTDADNISISGGGISFTVDRVPDWMTIKPVRYYEEHKLIYNDDMSALGVTQGTDKTLGKLDYTATLDGDLYIDMYAGAPHVWLGLLADVYQEGVYERHELPLARRVAIDASNITLVSKYDNTEFWVVAAYDATEKKTTFSIHVQTPTGARKRYLDAVTLIARVNGAGGEIRTKDGEIFLSNRNYRTSLPGVDGKFRQGMYWNNIQRQYVSCYESGRLVNYQVLTPTDAGFIDGVI